MIICSTLPCLRMLGEFLHPLLCLTIFSWNRLWRPSDSLAIWFCGPGQCTTFNQHFYHSDAVTMKTWHLFIHSHFVRTLHRQRASKINCRILDFSNAVSACKAVGKGPKKTKCQAVRTFSRISAKTLFLIVWKYSIFVENYQTIRKTRMASQLSGCGFLGIEQSRRRFDT